MEATAKKKGVRVGFGFVPFPIEIWRDGIDLTLGEFRLLGYLLYHQLKLGKPIIRLSDDELLNGRKAKDGVRLDGGCGLKGPNNLKSARAKLEERGWVTTEKTKYGHDYQIVLSESDDRGGSESDDGGSETDSQVSESDRKVSESDPPNKEYKNCTTQEGTTKELNPNASASPSLFGEEPASKKKPKTFGLSETEYLGLKDVWACYIHTFQKNPNTYTATDLRKQKGAARLRECVKKCGGNLLEAVAMMKRAIGALAADEWHIERRIIDWEYLFKSETKFEQILNRWQGPSAALVATSTDRDGTPQMSPEEAALREEAAVYEQRERKRVEREAALQSQREEYLKANGHDKNSQ